MNAQDLSVYILEHYGTTLVYGGDGRTYARGKRLLYKLMKLTGDNLETTMEWLRDAVEFCFGE